MLGTDTPNYLFPPFMVADRGDCTFVQKVRNIEESGAALAIIIDETDEDINDIIMSDDGTGAGIRIPSMMMSKGDGIKLLDWFSNASEEELF